MLDFPCNLKRFTWECFDTSFWPKQLILIRKEVIWILSKITFDWWLTLTLFPIQKRKCSSKWLKEELWRKLNAVRNSSWMLSWKSSTWAPPAFNKVNISTVVNHFSTTLLAAFYCLFFSDILLLITWQISFFRDSCELMARDWIQVDYFQARIMRVELVQLQILSLVSPFHIVKANEAVC